MLGFELQSLNPKPGAGSDGKAFANYGFVWGLWVHSLKVQGFTG